MKKIFTVVTISIIFATQLFAASKNPLKIFKKEILGGDAKKKMSLFFNTMMFHYQ